MVGLVRFGVSIPQELVEQFDRLIADKKYPNRSEAIRDLMRDYLVANDWEVGDEEVAGTITIVYNHHTRELSKALTQIQHDYHGEVCCTTHVHLDEHNCLEVIVVRGRPIEVKDLANQLISIKGVKHGQLVCTTTGKTLV
jgi:CopG family nickel-responsive transcriptional regulator